MLTLADIQAGIRDALVNGDGAAVAPVLLGGAHPERRLAIHQRHYVASLTRALVERFPATVWLVGSELVTHAATGFIREHPPSRPCVAEYGDGFPRYLGAHPAAEWLPYLAQFAELEWHLGRLALATDESANVQHVHLDWALDELIGLYLTDTSPDEFALRREEVWLEIRGLRGDLEMNRLAAQEFARRVAAQPTGAHS
ncbi:MAG TPA: DNA-binding domain-containing protein [Vicinamibacterales bacterium]|nr:DNA-binding domain-containing protein [Vicinamibacterales bacterium]